MIIEDIKEYNPQTGFQTIDGEKPFKDLELKDTDLRRKQGGMPVEEARTSLSADLSGSSITYVCFHTERSATLINAYLLYTEASSGDAGITVKIGKESDDDYYYTGTTETSKSQWYTKTITLLKNDITAGDTITFYSAGSKTGTGEIMLVIEYVIN